MERVGAALAVICSLVAAGIALSFLGSHLLVAGLETAEGSVGEEPLVVAAELDPQTSRQGVFAMIAYGADGQLQAEISGPDGVIISVQAESDSIEEFFDIGRPGAYSAQITSSSAESYTAAVSFGHAPDKGVYAVGLAGFWMIIAGMIGIVGLGSYAVRKKKRQLR